MALRGCRSTDNGMHGSEARSKARLTASDGYASGSSDTGFAVFSGACAVLETCTTAKNSEHGVCFGGEGSTLKADECNIWENMRCGVIAYDAAEVALSGCRSTDNGMHGFSAQYKAKLTVSDGYASGSSDNGFAVFGRACVVLEKCTAAKNSHYGVYARGEGSTVKADECTISKNVWSGVLASDAAEAVVTGCRSTENLRHGFSVCSGAHAVLKSCAANNNEWCGVHADGEGSKLEAESCTL